ncbi:rhodanese-like domain-containing protein [Desulfovibrio cuneatus]|uniref:rhodanese-like domain-containing protein n=1 Tax=Desulfovibrio cuneatus TaxID=159728 RepID=UPI0003F8297B|nr:rhodanese-like domain-containing protein [Desulfovibrio cuneatus]
MNNKQIQKNSVSSRWKQYVCVGLCALVLVLGSAGAGLAGQVVNVTNEDAKALLEKKEPLRIIDLRTPGEFSRGKIPGAENVDFYSSDFEARVAATAGQNSGPWLVYCRSGNRSTQALPVLQKRLSGTVYHLYKGIQHWDGPLE